MLLKPGKLTDGEFDLIRQHCEFGKRIVDEMSAEDCRSLARHTDVAAMIMNVGSSPTLRMATRIAMTHHEKWDGSGYPRGLRGEQIPLEGRITAVADVFDALSNDRPYKPAFPLEQCFAILKRNAASTSTRACSTPSSPAARRSSACGWNTRRPAQKRGVRFPAPPRNDADGDLTGCAVEIPAPSGR